MNDKIFFNFDRSEKVELMISDRDDNPIDISSILTTVLNIIEGFQNGSPSEEALLASSIALESKDIKLDDTSVLVGLLMAALLEFKGAHLAILTSRISEDDLVNIKNQMAEILNAKADTMTEIFMGLADQMKNEYEALAAKIRKGSNEDTDLHESVSEDVVGSDDVSSEEDDS